jgi:hypothetical protein
VTATPPSRSETLLATIQAFLHAEYGGSLEDGYSVISLRPRFRLSYWAPGDRFMDQIPARRALFHKVFGATSRLWVVTVNLDPRPFMKASYTLDTRETWTNPDWNNHVEHTLYGVETSPSGIDTDGMISAEVAVRNFRIICIAPDTKIGMQIGSVATPSFVFATSQADLDRVLADKPDGHWFAP